MKTKKRNAERVALLAYLLALDPEGVIVPEIVKRLDDLVPWACETREDRRELSSRIAAAKRALSAA